MKYTIIDAKTCPMDYVNKALKMKLKQIDIDEVEYMKQTPRQAIGGGIANSAYCKMLIDDAGEPQAVFGVVDNKVGYSIPWLLTTDEHEITQEWLKICKKDVFPMMCEGRKMFSNVCHKDNEATIKWLTWLGFSFQYFDEQFIRFMMNVEEIEPLCVVV